ncbi:hypothetical protein [Enterococcus songbeiensis]|uniref:hypothetical protein n=1 Tax=Enterococcus songbeiensis TaxID=2559927 RepID=UPI0010F5936C|nr:hypothetical protein [Enterococcus songbeiensis]
MTISSDVTKLANEKVEGVGSLNISTGTLTGIANVTNPANQLITAVSTDPYATGIVGKLNLQNLTKVGIYHSFFIISRISPRVFLFNYKTNIHSYTSTYYSIQNQ